MRFSGIMLSHIKQISDLNPSLFHSNLIYLPSPSTPSLGFSPNFRKSISHGFSRVYQYVKNSVRLILRKTISKTKTPSSTHFRILKLHTIQRNCKHASKKEKKTHRYETISKLTVHSQMLQNNFSRAKIKISI